MCGFCPGCPDSFLEFPVATAPLWHWPSAPGTPSGTCLHLAEVAWPGPIPSQLLHFCDAPGSLHGTGPVCVVWLSRPWAPPSRLRPTASESFCLYNLVLLVPIAHRKPPCELHGQAGSTLSETTYSESTSGPDTSFHLLFSKPCERWAAISVLRWGK